MDYFFFPLVVSKFIQKVKNRDSVGIVYCVIVNCIALHDHMDEKTFMS